MSVYLVVFFLLLIGALIEYVNNETPKRLFLFAFTVLTAMLAFRFGQGTDYLSYCSIYTTMPISIQEMSAYEFADVEWGWKILCAIFKLFGISFKGFVFAISAAEMICLWRFITRYCKHNFLALIMGYHTLFLTYYFSALRQGLVIAFFLGVMLQWLIDGKWIRYFLGVVLCTTIHTVGIVLLIPLLVCAIRISFAKTVCLVVVGLCVGSLCTIFNVGPFLKDTLGIHYFGDASISVIALGERVLSYVIVSYAAYLCLDGEEPEGKNVYFVLFKLYSLGVFLYGVLMWSPLVSSRTIYVYKVIEIALISYGITKTRKARSFICAYFILISSVLFFKNMNSYINEGEYRDTSIVTFPYISVFEPYEVLDARADVGRLVRWLEVDLDIRDVEQYEQQYRESHQK